MENIRAAWEKNGFDDPEWVKKQPGWYKYHPVEEWCTWASNMWDDVPKFLDETFPGWESVSAEEQLYESIAKAPASTDRKEIEDICHRKVNEMFEHVDLVVEGEENLPDLDDCGSVLLRLLDRPGRQLRRLHRRARNGRVHFLLVGRGHADHTDAVRHHRVDLL